MTFNDLTIIFLTINKVPDGWTEYQKEVLLKAVEDTPIITISRKPMDWGTNLIQDAAPSVSNIYRQVLRGAQHAKTPYIAIAEDDHLYPEEHFMHRPKNKFGYEMTRWGIHAWGTPTFYYKNRVSNGSMIAPREMVVEALEERFRRYPNNDRLGELGKEKGTRLKYRGQMENFWSTVGTIYISHKEGLDPLEKKEKKRMGMVRAYEIPYWGRAEEVIEHFK